MLAHGTERALDLGEAGGRVFVGIASCGFDSDANRIANETRLVRGNLVYAYGALRALAAWRPATFDARDRRPSAADRSGYTVAVANSKAYGGGMMMAPDALLDDGLLDVVMIGAMPKLSSCAACRVFSGAHVDRPDVEVIRAREVQDRRGPAVHDVRRRRSDRDLPVERPRAAGAVRVLTPR